MHFPTRGSFMGEWLFPFSSPFYPKGLTRGLEQSKNSGHTLVRMKKHPFCLRASTFTTGSFYGTTLNMKRSILKRKKDPREKKKKKHGFPHLTSFYVQETRGVLCSTPGTEWALTCIRAVKPFGGLWHMSLFTQKICRILQSQNSATNVIKEL